MGATSISTSHEISQKIWRPALAHSAEVQSLGMHFLGEEEDAGIQLVHDLNRNAGDKIQRRFSPTRDPSIFLENDTIEGNEDSLTFDSDELTINYAAVAYSQRNQMSQQRVNINLKKAALTKLPYQWRRIWDRGIFNQLAGYMPANTVTGYVNSCMNAVVKVDATHHVRPSTHTTDELVAADTAALMSLDLIDKLMVRTESNAYLDYVIPPTSSGYYYLVIHPEQKKQLRDTTAAGDWSDLQRALLEGGLDFSKSALSRGFVGLYANCVIVVSDHIPLGVKDADDTVQANTRRAVLIGANMGWMGFGKGYDDDSHLDWTEQVRDYKVWGVTADCVFGMKRTIFKNLAGVDQTYGGLVLTTYSSV